MVGVGVNIFNDECMSEYMNVPILETSLKSLKFGSSCTQKAFEKMKYQEEWDGTFLGQVTIILMFIISLLSKLWGTRTGFVHCWNLTKSDPVSNRHLDSHYLLRYSSTMWN